MKLKTCPALSNPAALGKGTDWQDEIFRTAPISNYKATLGAAPTR